MTRFWLWLGNAARRVMEFSERQEMHYWAKDIVTGARKAWR